MIEKNDKKQLLAIPMGLWAAAFVGLSLLYIIGLSLLTKGEGFSYSPPLTLDNYIKLREKQYISSLLLSLRLAFFTTLISAFVGYPFAYFISKASPKKRVWLLVMLIAPFWTNALIRIYGWKILFYANGPINTLLKSIGIIERPLKLLYTEGAVLIGMVYCMLPFFVLPVYSSVERIDWSMVEASRDLGASPLKAFITVTIPMTSAGVMAGLVLTFIPSVGLFFISDLLGGSNTMLWGNLIQNELLKSHDMPFAAALSVVLLAMTAIVLFIYRRQGGEAESMVY